MGTSFSDRLAVYTSLPRSVLVLCFGSFVNRAGSFIIPFLTIYATDELGYTKSFSGICCGAFGLGSILAAIVGGQLADRVGRRPVMLVALFGAATMLVILSQLRSQPAVLTGIFLFALIADMYRPAASAMLGDLVTSENRPAAFGLMYVAFNLGFGVAAGVGGFLAEYSFQLLFFGDALTTAAFGLIIAGFITETIPREAKTEKQADWRTALRRMTADTTFLLLAFATLLTSIVFMQGFSTLPMVMADVGIEKDTVGLLLSSNGWMIVLLQLPITAWLTRFHRVLVILVGEMLIGVGFGLTTFADTTLLFLATILVWTLGEVIQATFKQSLVADLAPADMRGRYMGVFSLCHAVGMTFGIPAASRILEDFGPQVLWPLCFTLVMVSSATYFAIYVRIRRVEAAVGLAAGESSV